jgi:hypothetical protein
MTVTPGGAFSAKLTFSLGTVSASGRLAVDDRQPGFATVTFTNQIGGRGVEIMLAAPLDSSGAVAGWVRLSGEDVPSAEIHGAMVANPSPNSDGSEAAGRDRHEPDIPR